MPDFQNQPAAFEKNIGAAKAVFSGLCCTGVVMHEILKQKKQAVLAEWIRQGEGNTLGKQKPHPVFNPVSHIIHTEWEQFYDAMIEEKDLSGELFSETLRLRAVQQMLPSAALLFVNNLKYILREKIYHDPIDKINLKQSELEDKLDKVLMESFDLYMKFRESIFNLKIEEHKRSQMPGGGEMSYSCPSGFLDENSREACQ
jgi:hypothetical protein